MSNPREQFIPIENLVVPDCEFLFQLFGRSAKFRKGDYLFEVISVNDSKKTVTLKLCGGFFTPPEQPLIEQP